VIIEKARYLWDLLMSGCNCEPENFEFTDPDAIEYVLIRANSADAGRYWFEDEDEKK
jgi:hypothetical protein